jgi:hypothetical protein
MSYFRKFVKYIWPCEHITRAPHSALEGTRASEGPWNLSFISFTVNPPHLNGKFIFCLSYNNADAMNIIAYSYAGKKT